MNKENNIVISVLMATHNPDLSYLRECLDSMERQTYRQFELVVIDDASDDFGLEQILDGCSFPTRIVVNEDQLGLAKSLNKGLKVARGKFIARIDDDDLMMPERLESQIAASEGNKGFIFSRAQIIDGAGNVVRETRYVNDIKNKLKRSGNCLIHSSLFVRKQVMEEIGGYDGNYVYVQDYALYMKALDQYDFYLIDKPLVQYRVVEGSRTFTKNALSRVYSFVADAEYFSRHHTFINRYYYYRRALILIKTIAGYAFKGKR